MEPINRYVRRIFAFGAGSSLMLIFGIIFLNAVRRYSIGKSFAWGEELPVYLAVYGVMFGIAYAYMTDSHIRFAVISDMLPERVRHWLFAVTDVITIIVGGALVFAGYAFVQRRGNLDSPGLKSTGDWLAEVTGLPALEWIGKVGVWQYAIAFGGVILVIAALLRLIERVTTPHGEASV